MNAISSYLSVHHALKVTLGSAAICASVSAETGIRAAYDLFALLRLPRRSAEVDGKKNDFDTDEKKLKTVVSYNLSANLGSSLFYGLCATNIFPGSSILGALIFTIYSNCVTKDEYLLSKAIRQPCRLLFNHVVTPLWNTIHPVLKKIADVTSTILSKISLPDNPIWYGVALLGTAIAVTKFALPVIGINLI